MAVELSEALMDELFTRSGGKCECTHQHTNATAPHHGGKCPRGFFRYGPLWVVNPVKASLSAAEQSKAESYRAVCYECNQIGH